MSRYRLELATESDDKQLRSVMALTPMDGAIEISFRREPSYFNALAVEGSFRQVIAARDLQKNQIIGLGTRSIGTRYVNGQPMEVGYLSSLRLLKEHRNGALMARGYRLLKQLDRDGRVPFYITTIATTNLNAKNLLTSGRAGLPRYLPFGEYHTIAIPTSPAKTRRETNRALFNDVSIQPAEPNDMDAIVVFLSRHGAKRQFFPCYSKTDFESEIGLLRGLNLSDLWLARSAGELAGMMGVWNQQPFRQNVVERYNGLLRYFRPVYNLNARIIGGPFLPSPGEQLRAMPIALPVVANNDPLIFQSLVSRIRQHYTQRDTDYLLLGMHGSDPLWPMAKSLGGRTYTTALFLATWQNKNDLIAQLENRTPYLELGSL